MTRRIISASIKTAVAIFILFILLFAFGVALLKFGLSFKNVDVGGVEIGQLYLKIDKKLIIEIDRVILKPSDKPLTPKMLSTRMRQGFLALYFIERFDLKAIDTPQGPLAIHYEKGLFSARHDKGELTAALGWMEPGVAFEIKSLTWQEHNLTAEGRGFFTPISGWFFADFGYASDLISGTLNAWGDSKKASLRLGRNQFNAERISGTFAGTVEVDLKTGDWDFEGDGAALGIEGDLLLEGRGEIVRARLLDATAKTLEPLADYLFDGQPYHPWVYGNIIARHYEAREFALDINRTSGHPLYETLFLDATALNGEIRFHPDLTPAVAEELGVAIANNTLHVLTRNGNYEDQEAEAHLTLENLVSRGEQHLRLEIETPALFNASIRQLLAAYGAEVNIEQHSGMNRTTFTLTLEPGKTDAIRTAVTGRALDGSVDLFGLNLLFDETHLEVDDNKVTIRRADLNLPGVGNLLAHGTVEFKEKRFELQGQARNISLLGGWGADISDAKVTALGEWNGSGVSISLPELDSRLRIGDDRFELTVEDLSRVRDYVPLMDLFDLTGGRLQLLSGSGRTVADFNITTGSPVLYLEDKPVLQANGRIEVEGQNTLINLLNGRVTIEREGEFLKGKVSRLEIDADAVETFLKRRQNSLPDVKTTPGALSPGRLFFFGDKTAIRYKKRHISTDWFSLHIDGDSADGQIRHGNSTLTINRNKSDLTLRGEKVSTEWVKELTGMEMTGGNWDMTAYANLNNEDVYGVVRLKDATFKQARLLTNVIAVVNTLPSLVQFRSPGFSAEGFTVERGVIEFYYASDTLFFNAIRLMGTNTDIIGQGSINLKTGAVDIYASVQTVKAASSLIGSIPLVGYLLLGDSKKIENVLHITGTTENPVVESEVGKELLFYPLGVIQRTLTLPLKLFE